MTTATPTTVMSHSKIKVLIVCNAKESFEVFPNLKLDWNQRIRIRAKKKNLTSITEVLHKTSNSDVSENGKEIYQNEKRMCGACIAS